MNSTHTNSSVINRMSRSLTEKLCYYFPHLYSYLNPTSSAPFPLAYLPFPLAVRSGTDAVSVISTLCGNTDSILCTLCQSLSGTDSCVVEAEYCRLQSLLSSLDDPHGKEAYALTCILSACAHRLSSRDHA